MKTAIYIEDGVTQLVLTPENEFEENVVKSFSDKEFEAFIYEGAFYDCRGGWVRQKHFDPSHSSSKDDKSLIIRTEKKEG